MKQFSLCFILLFCFNTINAQKETVVNKADTKVVNQKLVQLQTTVKKLQTTLREAQKLLNTLQKQKDALSEMNKEDMFWMQKLMEQKSQLEQMISNTMKAASESQTNIARNLKAS